MNDITYVGLDVHKASIAVSLAEGGGGGEAGDPGMIAHRPEALRALAARLSQGGRRLSFCDQTGPCGYDVHRRLSGPGLGRGGMVVAPSLRPRRPGERVTTSRRDSTSLAKLHRAGALTSVWRPDAAHEAMRDLVRAAALPAQP